MEVSPVLFVLISEGFVVLIITLLLWLFYSSKNKKIDRKAVQKLVKQIKHQSSVRLEKTGSFLSEKYRFEGDELKRAVKSLDKSEKKFYQKLILMYLKRDSESLSSMDSSVSELIDSYKSLSPVMPDTADADALLAEMIEELERLRVDNAELSEKLIESEAAVNDMVNEFGNLFGGGSDNDLANHEVVEKMAESHELG